MVSHLTTHAGMERKVIELLNNLDHNLFECSIAVFTTIDKDVFDLLSPNIKIHSLNKRKGIHLSMVLKLFKLLKQTKTDIIHSHNWPTFFHSVLAAKLAKTPAIIHGEHGRETRVLKLSWKRKIVQRLLYVPVDNVLVVAKDLGAVLENTFAVPTKRIACIPNGVKIPDETDGQSTRNDSRSNLGIPESAFVIGSVGRMSPVKDFPTLIKAFSRIRQVNRNSLLLIGGPEDPNNGLKMQLEQFVKELGLQDHVLFPGVIDNVPAFMSALDVYVNSSVSEGMSNTILEAMATGLPVVASNVGGTPELLKNNETGFLFESQNARECSEKINLLMTNEELRKQIGTHTYQYVKANHSFQRMCNSYAALYKQHYKYVNEPLESRTELIADNVSSGTF